jgi:hypothetical protein
MNREQAHAAIYDAWDRALNGSRQIGLRKQAGVNFIAKMTTLSGWQRPDAVADDLAKAGFRIVRAP